jgi:hypothetical protein
MPAQPTRTLTQRRATASSSSVASSINTPPPMAPTNLTSSQTPKSEEGSNSLMKIAIWGVVVLLIAAAVYLLINNVMSKGGTEDVTPTPTVAPTEAAEPETINASKLDSKLAESAPSDSDFKKSDQTVGAESEDQFSIQSFKTESYDKFFRLLFEVSSSGTNSYPLVTATYNEDSNSIDLAFKGIVNDNSGLEFEVPQKVEGSVVTSITRRATSEEDVAKYTIGISESTGFYLHTLSDPNRIVVDIKETVPTPTPSVTTTVTPTPDTDSGEKPAAPHLTNEFSQNKQYIVTTLTANTVSTPKYAFRDFGTYLKITYDLSGGIPNVSAELDGTDLIVVMSNRISSNKSTSVDINNGNVKTMDVVSSGNTTTYTLHLIKAADYRIYATESPAQFMIEVKD